jgi:integrase
MTYGHSSDGKIQPEGVTVHTTRHTLATWLCQDDVQLTKIAALLGDTVETVALHYAHHLPTDLERAVAGLLA